MRLFRAIPASLLVHPVGAAGERAERRSSAFQLTLQHLEVRRRAAGGPLRAVEDRVDHHRDFVEIGDGEQRDEVIERRVDAALAIQPGIPV